MKTNEIWNKMVSDSRNLIEDFDNFADDTAIVWADKEMKNYKRAMMMLIESQNNCNIALSTDDKKFIETMFNRAQAQA